VENMPAARTIPVVKAFSRREETDIPVHWSIPVKQSVLTVKHPIVCTIGIINALQIMWT
jgi:hypothetical protein